MSRCASRDDDWWCITEPGSGPRSPTGCNRFRIRVKAEIEDASSDVRAALAVRGATTPRRRGARSRGRRARVDAAAWRRRHRRPARGRRRGASHSWLPRASTVGSRDEYEAARIAAGVPRLGVDIDERTIPQEAFLERDAVSFTKGCFLGQELVCRIDTRGHVNRYLRRVHARRRCRDAGRRRGRGRRQGRRHAHQRRRIGRRSRWFGARSTRRRRSPCAGATARSAAASKPCDTRSRVTPGRRLRSRERARRDPRDQARRSHGAPAAADPTTCCAAARSTRRRPARSRGALRRADGHVAVIAEIKRRSPSKGDARPRPRSGRDGQGVRARRRGGALGAHRRAVLRRRGRRPAGRPRERPSCRCCARTSPSTRCRCTRRARSVPTRSC